jgi:chaperone required for assembly of F1-ATPase
MAAWPPDCDHTATNDEAPMTKPPTTEPPITTPYDATPIAEKVLGREPLRPPLPKKFYTTARVAEVDGHYAIQLDGRTVRTPKKLTLAVPTAALGKAIAAEWQAQVGVINPATMPLTKLANTVIDGILGQEAAIAEEITRFSGSDLLCYRASGPVELANRQLVAWGPIVHRAGQRLGAAFNTTAGLMPVAQPAATLAAVARRLAPCTAYELAAAHVITTLTGSAILALERLDNAIAAPEIWAAAHVDEDYQIELWGPDDEAAARRAFRWLELQSADQLLTLLGRPA